VALGTGWHGPVCQPESRRAVCLAGKLGHKVARCSQRARHAASAARLWPFFERSWPVPHRQHVEGRFEWGRSPYSRRAGLWLEGLSSVVLFCASVQELQMRLTVHAGSRSACCSQHCQLQSLSSVSRCVPVCRSLHPLCTQAAEVPAVVITANYRAEAL
jgi:hypothetical protein